MTEVKYLQSLNVEASITVIFSVNLTLFIFSPESTFTYYGDVTGHNNILRLAVIFLQVTGFDYKVLTRVLVNADAAVDFTALAQREASKKLMKLFIAPQQQRIDCNFRKPITFYR